MAKNTKKKIPTLEEGKPSPPLQARAWEVILYPDCEADMESLAVLSALPRVAWILHDKDIDEMGTPKKPHIHCIRVFDSPTTQGSMEKLIPNTHSNQIRRVSSLDAALLYLTHANNPEKAQYRKSEINTTMQFKIDAVYNKTADAADELMQILDFVEVEYGLNWSTLADVVRWCCSKGFYGTMRQNSALINNIVRETIQTHREHIFDSIRLRSERDIEEQVRARVVQELIHEGIIHRGTNICSAVCQTILNREENIKE